MFSVWRQERRETDWLGTGQVCVKPNLSCLVQDYYCKPGIIICIKTLRGWSSLLSVMNVESNI